LDPDFDTELLQNQGDDIDPDAIAEENEDLAD